MVLQMRLYAPECQLPITLVWPLGIAFSVSHEKLEVRLD
jgi:hypothetical protein